MKGTRREQTTISTKRRRRRHDGGENESGRRSTKKEEGGDGDEGGGRTIGRRAPLSGWRWRTLPSAVVGLTESTARVSPFLAPLAALSSFSQSRRMSSSSRFLVACAFISSALDGALTFLGFLPPLPAAAPSPSPSSAAGAPDRRGDSRCRGREPIRMRHAREERANLERRLLGRGLLLLLLVLEDVARVERWWSFVGAWSEFP